MPSKRSEREEMEYDIELRDSTINAPLFIASS